MHNANLASGTAVSSLAPLIAPSLHDSTGMSFVCDTREPDSDVACPCGLLGGVRPAISPDVLEKEVLAFRQETGKIPPSCESADEAEKRLAIRSKNMKSRHPSWTPSWEQWPTLALIVWIERNKRLPMQEQGGKLADAESEEKLMYWRLDHHCKCCSLHKPFSDDERVQNLEDRSKNNLGWIASEANVRRATNAACAAAGADAKHRTQLT